MGVAAVPDKGFWRSPQGTEATYCGRLPQGERADGEGCVLRPERVLRSKRLRRIRVYDVAGRGYGL